VVAQKATACWQSSYLHDRKQKQPSAPLSRKVPQENKMLLQIHPNDHRFTYNTHTQNKQNYPMLAMPRQSRCMHIFFPFLKEMRIFCYFLVGYRRMPYRIIAHPPSPFGLLRHKSNFPIDIHFVLIIIRAPNFL
jgi:hypothetical protein